MKKTSDTRIVQLKNIPMLDSLDKYFNQFDSHCHSFSRCVREQRGLPSWELHNIPFAEKIKFIRQSIDQIYSQAREKGIKVQCITEHPQFKQYSIPFGQYIREIERARQKHGAYFAALPIGIEIDIKKDEQGKAYLDLEEISDGEMDPLDMLSKVDVIVAGAHSKGTRGKVEDSEDYATFLARGVFALAELRQTLETKGQRKKVYVLGHPWDAAAKLNSVEYDILQKVHSEYIQSTCPTFESYESSQSAKVAFFHHKQLETLSNALVENDIFPEVNLSSVVKGLSDIRLRGATPKETIIENYIRKCMLKKITPIISIGSDSHKIEDIGNNYLSKFVDKVPNLEKAIVWCEKYLLGHKTRKF
jgi:histidinol phosphatase-like PHP family hydrolase